jgi:hypothetical protein
MGLTFECYSGFIFSALVGKNLVAAHFRCFRSGSKNLAPAIKQSQIFTINSKPKYQELARTHGI